MNQRGEINLHLVLTIFLGIGMALFGALAIVAYRDNTTTQANVNQIASSAADKAATTQKKQDTIANTAADEQPYQTYTAPAVYGGFSLQLPKDWSTYITLGSSNSFQLVADPGFITQNSGSTINTHEFQLQLENESTVDINKTFESALKKGTIVSKPVTVSGIAATWFEGVLDSQRHDGVVVTFPDRNQTVVMTTQTHDYISEFTAIMNSAKFNP